MILYESKVYFPKILQTTLNSRAEKGPHKLWFSIANETKNMEQIQLCLQYWLPNIKTKRDCSFPESVVFHQIKMKI